MKIRAALKSIRTSASVLLLAASGLLLASCTITTYDANGVATTFMPDGSQVKQWPSGYAKQYFPDGRTKVLQRGRGSSGSRSTASKPKPKPSSKPGSNTSSSSAESDLGTFVPAAGDHEKHEIVPHGAGETKGHTSGEHKHD